MAASKKKAKTVQIGESISPAWRAKGKVVWPEIMTVGFGRNSATEEVDADGKKTGEKKFLLGSKTYGVDEIVFVHDSDGLSPNITASWSDEGWAQDCFKKLGGHFSAIVVGGGVEWSKGSVDSAAFLLESTGALIVNAATDEEGKKVRALVEAHKEFLPVAYERALVFYRV